MSDMAYRYQFRKDIPMLEVEGMLCLALVGVQSIHGQTQTRLEAGHALDSDRQSCVIDARTPIGEDLNRLMVGYLQQAFGDDAFRIETIRLGKQREVHYAS